LFGIFLSEENRQKNKEGDEHQAEQVKFNLHPEDKNGEV